jgi:endo-1,4-beta-xylanase
MLICQVRPSLPKGFFSPSSLVSNAVCSDWYSQCTPGSGGGSNPTTTAGGGGTPTTTRSGGAATGTGLNDKFKAKGKTYFGTEIDHYHLSNTALTNIVKSSFGQVTCENSMKWDAIEGEYYYPVSP